MILVGKALFALQLCPIRLGSARPLSEQLSNLIEPSFIKEVAYDPPIVHCSVQERAVLLRTAPIDE